MERTDDVKVETRPKSKRAMPHIFKQKSIGEAHGSGRDMQMDVVTAAAQSETLKRPTTGCEGQGDGIGAERNAAEEHQGDLVKFGKDEFDEALWNHRESLANGKRSLESDIRGFEQERRTVMKEAVEFKPESRSSSVMEEADMCWENPHVSCPSWLLLKTST